MLLARLLALAAAAAARRIPTGGFVAAAPRAPSPRLRSRVALRRPRTTKAVAVAAIPTALLYESTTQLVNDAGCTAGAAAGAVAWIKIWTSLAEKGVIDAKLARKIVHCGSGPLYLLVWRFYSDASLARVVAALVPALNILKLQKASQDDNELSRAISRSGDPSEVLGGPYVYTWVLLLAALLAFRTPYAVVAVAQMAVGDGLADIVGRRFGSKKWFCNSEKSYAGSVAFVLGATVASIGLLRWLGFPAPLMNLVAISVICALVEVLLTTVDDKVSVPLVGGLLALTIT